MDLKPKNMNTGSFTVTYSSYTIAENKSLQQVRSSSNSPKWQKKKKKRQKTHTLFVLWSFWKTKLSWATWIFKKGDITHTERRGTAQRGTAHTVTIAKPQDGAQYAVVMAVN